MLERVQAAWPAGVRHGFTSREGGVSVGSLATLNLARRPGESAEALLENWRRVAGALGRAVEDVAIVDQVHGAEVLRVEAPGGPTTPLGRADALVTDAVGVVLAVRIADCVPIVVAGPRAIAAIHAGWRGVASGVVGVAIAALRALDDGPLVAAIGPHAGRGAYEVGDEVIAGLRSAGIPDAIAVAGVTPRGRARADLGGAVAFQLRTAGVATIAHHGGCTLTDPRYFSHRRDGDAAGRMAAVITRVPA